jgi:hypothetical protein
VTLQDFCRIEGPIEPFFDCIYFRDIGDEFGYAYVVPKGNVAIVGSVFYPKTKRPHVKHEQMLKRLRQALPLGESVKREAWVALSVRHNSDIVLGDGRVLLAGEAGGFMTPGALPGLRLPRAARPAPSVPTAMPRRTSARTWRASFVGCPSWSRVPGNTLRALCRLRSSARSPRACSYSVPLDPRNILLGVASCCPW